MSGLASASEIARAVVAGETTAECVAVAALTAIDETNGALNAFTQVFHERALEQARSIDTRLRAGEAVGPLAGVPVAVKDNICLRWGKTTCASRMLEHYASPFNATAVTKLLAAGAVVVGKTNMDEFGMGSSCEHSIFGASMNPWDPARVPGGSSGGSAAAVGAGVVPIALGSDTGGSIRQPASLCGCVGLKPTYGRVSRYGLVAFASSLDQIGPLTRTVADAGRCLAAMAGPDEHDATTAELAPGELARWLDASDPMEGFNPDLVRIGVARSALEMATDPAVRSAFNAAIDALESLGVTLVDVELPNLDAGVAAYYLVAPAEASSNLARFDGVRYGHRAEDAGTLEAMYRMSRAEGFGPEVRRRIMLGTHALSSGYHDAYYLTALKARRLIRGDYDRAFTGEAGAACDAVLLPTAPGPAFVRGAKLDDPLALYLEDVYTVGASLAGLPAISLPAGFARVEGAAGPLPVGVQLVGPAFGEAGLLRLSTALEAALAPALAGIGARPIVSAPTSG